MSRVTSRRRSLWSGLTSRSYQSFYLLFSMFALCTLFYYFGELVDYAGWMALRWDFFYGVHDIHRLLFLAPIVYAGYVFGVRGTVIITILAVAAFLPRALFVSPYPDPTLRMVLFSIVAGTIGYLTATTRREFQRRSSLEALLRSERDKLLGILERMQDGVLIVGPDYRIRYMNPSMIRDFGEGVGSYCYERLYQLEVPCQRACKLPGVLKGAIEKWDYTLPDGTTYEVLASPYTDADGTICQIATFRNLSKRGTG